MNSRIEIVSDIRVNIKRQGHNNPFDFQLRVDDKDGLWLESDHCRSRWDAEGRAALRDCINCLEATGSFAALADTSAVPWIGKRVRRDGYEVKIVQVPVCGSEWCKVEDADGCVFTVSLDSLFPLEPPKPKVRPYTPVEAAAHLDREFIFMSSKIRLELIGEAGVYQRAGWSLPFDRFASECTWTDDGSACGVVED